MNEKIINTLKTLLETLVKAKAEGNNKSISKTQVRDGLSARFSGIINKIALNKKVGFFTNDLDAVLICTYCTVGAQSEK